MLEWHTEQRTIKELIPAEYNPRKLTDKQRGDLEKSIKKFNLVEIPAINLDNTLLAGHQRVALMVDLGRGGEVIDVRVPNRQLTDDEAKEYNLRSNKNTGEWDMDKLFAMPKGLLEGVGFDNKEIQKLIDTHTEAVEDDYDVAEGLKQPCNVVKGDIWQLGNHRLMCGDSTKREDVEKLMDGKKADMVFTSPPYNADTKTGEGDIFNKKGSKEMYQGIYKDKMSSEDYVNFAENVLSICFENTEGFIFWNVSYNAKSRFEYIRQIESKLEYLIEQIAWKKSSAIPIKGSMRRAWEPIYVFSTHRGSLGTEEVETNVWEVSNTNSQMENHKACFPVGLPYRAIKIVKNSKIVFDPFLGSGSTLIACEQTNRICYGMEIDEHYCQVIIDRWEKHTGKKANKISV